MRSKASRWLLLLDVVVISCVILFAAYTVSTRVLPLGRVEQRRKVDPQTQLLSYYRQYPERYILITKESWQYDQSARRAYHFLTLRNTATVGYSSIEVRFSYETSSGKSLQTETVKIPSALPALSIIELKKIAVRNVPAAAEKVVSAVTKAQIY